MVKSLGDFELFEWEGMYYPGTILFFKDHVIMSDKGGNILIYSVEHNKSYIFKGSGGSTCVHLKVQDNLLY